MILLLLLIALFVGIYVLYKRQVALEERINELDLLNYTKKK